jgi:IS5 family transposase
MHRTDDRSQPSFFDFNQPIGLHMNPNNRWIRIADIIPWRKYEKKYSSFFKNDKRVGNISKPFRMALGSMLIQQQHYGFSDRELVEQLTENPYYQYFIGLSGCQEEAPFDPNLMVYFRKRVNQDILTELNLDILERESRKKETHKETDNRQDPPTDAEGGSASPEEDTASGEEGNAGTLILDSTCVPQNIRYPQDFSLINEAGEKLEQMIDIFCETYDFRKPRTYRETARKNYIALAMQRKRSVRKIRRTIKVQLNFIRRDIKYPDQYMGNDGYAPLFSQQLLENFLTIRVLYDQQLYMYQNHIHSVPDRIVSIAQPYIRPIVRRKAKSPVEFGTKIDFSIDEDGYARLEKASFDPYNEGRHLIDACEKFRQRTGHYPERLLMDTIYRNRENRRYCREHGIRISGPKLGRYDTTDRLQERKIEYQDNIDRIEVERAFSLAKRCYGLGLIRCKMPETMMTTIALSVFAMSLFRIHRRILFLLFGNYQLFKEQRNLMAFGAA